MRDFAIIGLGNFGATVARSLSELGIRVTAIDASKDRAQKVQDELHTCIVADATAREVLEQLGVPHFECFVVSTGENTHTSIMITLYLSEMKAKRIVVKARSQDHATILQKVGATDTVIPEQQMAERLSYSLARSDVIDYLPLTEGYSITEVTAPTKLVGKSLRELDLRNRYRIQMIAAKPNGQERFDFAPDGGFVINEDDIMIVLGKTEDIDKLRG